MMRKLTAAGVTDVGRTRQQNEDRLLVQPPLVLVADGMGGHALGDTAAQAVVDAFARPNWQELRADTSRIQELTRCASSAHEEILRLSQTVTGTRGDGAVVGATVAGALLCADNLHWLVFHAGDSRAYLWRNNALTQITTDHSYVQALVDSGAISRAEARSHPQRNIVLRAIGSRGDNTLEFQTNGAQPGDVILVCSDGLTDGVTDAEIAKTLRDLSSETLQAQAYGLRDVALSHGGHDNISAALLKIGEQA